jgi:hypothetical protein
MALLGVAAATTVALLAASAHAQQAIAVVKRSKGEVLVERGGARVPIGKGTELRRGDRVVTGRDGYAYIDIHGAAPVAVGPEMSVGLDRFVPDDKRVANRAAPRLLQGIASFLTLNRLR